MRKRFEATRVFKNKHGYRGIWFSNIKNKFVATIWPVAGVRGKHLGYFDTAIEAAQAYDDAARKEYGADAFLNFPREGEKQAVQSQLAEGVCAKGHALEEHGRVNVKGEPYCKLCNAMASKRRWDRKKAQDAEKTFHVKQRGVGDG